MHDVLGRPVGPRPEAEMVAPVVVTMVEPRFRAHRSVQQGLLGHAQVCDIADELSIDADLGCCRRDANLDRGRRFQIEVEIAWQFLFPFDVHRQGSGCLECVRTHGLQVPRVAFPLDGVVGRRTALCAMTFRCT